MNEPNDTGAVTPVPEDSIDTLQQAYKSLRLQFEVLLGILILLIGSLGIYLYCQVALVQRQIEEQELLLADYQQNSQPLIQDFLNRMQAFARTNAEFAQVFGKYVRPESGGEMSPASPAKK